MEVETLSDTLAEVNAQSLVDATAYTLAHTDAKTLIDTVAEVKAETLNNALPYWPTKVELEPLYEH